MPERRASSFATSRALGSMPLPPQGPPAVIRIALRDRSNATTPSWGVNESLTLDMVVGDGSLWTNGRAARSPPSHPEAGLRYAVADGFSPDIGDLRGPSGPDR